MSTWHNVGGGSFVGVGDNELGSDTEYENEETGQGMEFVSTAELRYSDLFPEKMSDDEMAELVRSLEGRTDVEAHGPWWNRCPICKKDPRDFQDEEENKNNGHTLECPGEPSGEIVNIAAYGAKGSGPGEIFMRCPVCWNPMSEHKLPKRLCP